MILSNNVKGNVKKEMGSTQILYKTVIPTRIEQWMDACDLTNIIAPYVLLLYIHLKFL